MPACAYCREIAPATAEHIWPEKIIARYKSLLTYNNRNQSFHGGEPTIKDVCEKCNSGKLSQLDNYAVSEFDKQIGQIVHSGENLTFAYDHEKLLRFLLKVSYNSTRSAGTIEHAQLHEKYAKFILNGGPVTSARINLQIVTSAHRLNIETMKIEERALLPIILRCANIQLKGGLADRFVVKLVAINSYWFYIFISCQPEPEDVWGALAKGWSNINSAPGIRLLPSIKAITIAPEQTTYFDPRLIDSFKGASRSKPRSK